MPHQTTHQLAGGQIDGRDQLQVILVTRYGRRALVQVIWPMRPTVVEAGQYPNMAAAVMRLLAEASVSLAATKFYKR